MRQRHQPTPPSARRGLPVGAQRARCERRVAGPHVPRRSEATPSLGLRQAVRSLAPRYVEGGCAAPDVRPFSGLWLDVDAVAGEPIAVKLHPRADGSEPAAAAKSLRTVLAETAARRLLAKLGIARKDLDSEVAIEAQPAVEHPAGRQQGNTDPHPRRRRPVCAVPTSAPTNSSTAAINPASVMFRQNAWSFRNVSNRAAIVGSALAREWQ
jgi:hypothetical protein